MKKPSFVGSLAEYQREVFNLWGAPEMELAQSVSADANAGVEPFIPVNTGSGSVTITLPPAAGLRGRWYIIKKTAAANTLTIEGNAAETIDGALNVALAAQYAATWVLCDGSNWHIIAEVA